MRASPLSFSRTLLYFDSWVISPRLSPPRKALPPSPVRTDALGHLVADAEPSKTPDLDVLTDLAHQFAPERIDGLLRILDKLLLQQHHFAVPLG